jgi:hypothetical protein
MAYFLKWQTRDLVWSLWLSSLVTGYLTILSSLGAGAYLGLALIRHPDFKKEQLMPALLIGGGIGLFLLAFFSIHFCGFHAGHSVFLNSFFPLEGLPDDGFGDAFMNPPLLWLMVFRHLMGPYGLFLIPAVIAERNHLFMPLIKTVRAMRVAMGPGRADTNPAALVTKPGADNPLMKDAMGRPYLNVVRMHCLIFFFAFCHFLKIDNFLVYVVVYSVYFFPWDQWKRRPQSLAPEGNRAA